MPQQTPRIEPMMTLRPTAAAVGEYDLLIYGDIGESWWSESVSAKAVADALMALPAETKKVNGYVNSYGGSVSEGIAIHTQLNALKARGVEVVIRVDGVAMSIASLIITAASRVTMAQSGIVMVHAPWSGALGNAEELRRYADVLDTYAAAMAHAYTAKTGKPHAEMLALLTDGIDHYYTADEALALGLVDEVIALGQSEPTESARAMAAGMIPRLTRAPERYAQLAIAACLRASAHPFAAPAANPAPAAVPAPSKEVPMSDAKTQAGGGADRAAILAADRDRRKAIHAHFERFELTAELRKLQEDCQDDTDCTPEAAAVRLLEALAAGKKPAANNPRVEAGLDERDHFRAGAVQALQVRASPGANKHTEQSKPFVGMQLIDFARESLAMAGVSTRGMSRNEIAVRALHSGSDLPYIFENTIGKLLRRGYESTPRTFVPFCRQGSLPDFKTASRIQLSGAPSLLRVMPGSEYEEGTVSDGKESIRLLKYGRVIGVDWEMIINDDLDALTRIPQAFGASAADLESDLVYGVFTANANMADATPLFHADHKNLGTAGAPSEGTLSEMRRLMVLQKGLDGRPIALRPEFLIVPPKHTVTALKLVSSVVANATSDVNVFAGSLQVIEEPRLHDASADAWYGAASPNRVDTIEYAYLEGNEGVFTETRNGFEVDGLQIKCRHVVGVKAIDWRGLFKNAGA